ncbi:Cytochrome c-type biogenesis protein DsbD,protein-disulfide reductase [Cronobacter universalis NCTC 9529]|nr:Cytochrome c-type biogenesis protein DsbD,protein-disulfide reductase [Cronobacter universalis NCTC 9529]
MAQRILTLILLFFSAQATASLFGQQNASSFVPADQAFAFDFQQQQHQLTLNWQIKPGYYLYRQQIHVTPANASVSPPALPAGEPHEDEFFGKSEIYRDALSVPVTVEQACARRDVNGDVSGLRRRRFLLSAGNPHGAAERRRTDREC